MVTRMLATTAMAFGLMASLGGESAKAQNVTQPIVRVTNILVTSVAAEDGQLVADAVVTLDVSGRVVLQEVQIPVVLDGSPGEVCPILHLRVGPLNLNLLGLVVNLDNCAGGSIVVNIDAVSGEGLLGDLLCGVAGLLDGDTGLNQILAGLDPDELLALTTTVQAVLNDLFEGILNTGGALSAAQHAGGHTQQTCDILKLELPGGINLELLGLVVDTSPICLDVFAQRGSGNLLGNLLCSLTELLDGPSNTQVHQALVRNIVRLLNRLGL